MRPSFVVLLAAIALGGCFYTPVSLEGLPPPCIAGYVEIDGGCYLESRRDGGASDATIDAHLDAPEADAGCECRDALGECRAGDSIDACGRGGGTCEVCCSDGTDACESGRCVPIAARRVAEVVAGTEHTCARLESGELYCWGADRDGQLGAPDRSTSSSVPLRVGGANDWRSIDGSDSSMCGIRAGTLRCWGRNSTGQLAQGTSTTGDVTPSTIDVDTPIPGRTWSDARVGRFHGCGIATDGSTHCWGSNTVHALQQAATEAYPMPMSVPDPASGGAWDAVRVGLHRTCMLHGGEQWCVGYAGAGRLGVASFAPTVPPRPHYASPMRVAPSLSWRELALGSAHSCGITADDRLYCWGCGALCPAATCDPMNVDIVDVPGGGDPRGSLDCTFALGSALEDGTLYSEDPIAVGTERFLRVAASDHTCAILADAESDDGAGPLVCFGPNGSGQLGDGTTEPHGFSIDAAILGGARFSAVSTGRAHTCAIRDTGALYCWGSNADYRLAIDEATVRDHPRPERVCFR